MSYRQYFSEVEAVADVLEKYVRSIGPEDFHPAEDMMLGYDTEELFTAIWQAVELLSRANQVLLPLISLDVAKSFINLTDSVVSDEE